MHVKIVYTTSRRTAPAQAVTAYRVEAARLVALNPRLRGVRLGNFQLSDKGLWLGDLRGNRCSLGAWKRGGS